MATSTAYSIHRHDGTASRFHDSSLRATCAETKNKLQEEHRHETQNKRNYNHKQLHKLTNLQDMKRIPDPFWHLRDGNTILARCVTHNNDLNTLQFKTASLATVNDRKSRYLFAVINRGVLCKGADLASSIVKGKTYNGPDDEPTPVKLATRYVSDSQPALHKFL